MMGSEHRRALPILPFGVVGVADAPGTGDDHRALTAAVCELVVVTNALFSAKCTGQGGSILYSKAVVLARKAHTWVVDVFQPVLGPAHTTKFHRMSAHLLDEFRLRGIVTEGNSAYNEALRKAVKVAYKLTIRNRNQFVEQLVLSEQVYTLMHDGEEGSTDEEEAPKIDTDSVGYDSQGKRSSRRQMRKMRQRQRRRRYSKKYSVAELARVHSIPGLAAVLCRSESTLLCKSGNM